MTYEEIVQNYKVEKISFEVAMDKLADIGYCPALLNDDNGRWAVSFTGFQSVPEEEPTDMMTSFLVEADSWKESIREAFLYALEK